MKQQVFSFVITLDSHIDDEFFIIRCPNVKDYDVWKIQDGCYVIDEEGKWVREPLNSDITEQYIKKTRFSLMKCLKILEEIERTHSDP